MKILKVKWSWNEMYFRIEILYVYSKNNIATDTPLSTSKYTENSIKHYHIKYIYLQIIGKIIRFCSLPLF